MARQTELRTSELASIPDDPMAVGAVPLSPRLAPLVAMQCVGYLLLWVQFHAIKNVRGDYLTNPDRLPTGWYGPGTAYTAWVGRLRPLQHLFHTPWAMTLLMGGAFALILAGYLGSLRAIRWGGVKMRTVPLLLLTVLIALPMLATPQLLSGDLWAYILYGRVAVLHGGNPFINAPAAYPGDAFLPRMAWKTTPAVYGPAWVLVSVGLTKLAELCGGAPGTYVVIFKLFMFLIHLANTLIVRRILRLIRPQRQTLGAVLYAWNPLCVIEFCGSGHNDCFMLFLLLIGIWCAAAGRSKSAVGWITAGALAKLPGILCLPAYSLWIARGPSKRGSREVALHVLVAVLVAVVLYAPFWRGLDTLRATANAPNLKIMWRSPASAIAQAVEHHLAHGKPIVYAMDEIPPPGTMPARVRSTVRGVSLLCFLICFVPLTLRRVVDFDDWLDRIVCIDVAYLLFAAFEFNPWYATWLVPLAALVRKPSPLLLATTLMLLAFYLPVAAHGLAVIYLWPLYVLFLVHVLPTLFGRRRTIRAEIPTAECRNS